MYKEDLPQGAVRQRSSGALIFPVHPRELKAQKDRAELAKELEEIKRLKLELQDIKNSFTEKEE